MCCSICRSPGWRCAAWSAIVHAARRSLAGDLSGLDAARRHEPTLCAGWDVEHVVAHLTAAATTGRRRWIRSIALAGFRPAVHNDRRLREHLGSTPQETLTRFQAVTEATIAPTGTRSPTSVKCSCTARTSERWPVGVPTSTSSTARGATSSSADVHDGGRTPPRRPGRSAGVAGREYVGEERE
ncbi:maleylpyruvate isomerase N-terminal domain-containing protein [Actinoplanes sp. OR16]|uniref:maleylpyruvate isomerase N-terminal domain-containing protein n=1 Tax=Actinoplanes sp. OR16 TaxID=946334 RepID=UPI0018D599B5|nr:maleylpyruvate isomerase N-terminal domain-containing protein [Actinoplanes sp. OR16]